MAVRTRCFLFRETRSIPGNESMHPDKIVHPVGDLIMSLIEILPVRLDEVSLEAFVSSIVSVL